MSRKPRKPSLRSISSEPLEPRLMLSATVAEVEPNDRSAQQFSFPQDGQVHIVGTASGRKDKDFFVFTAPSSGALSVNVASQNGAVSLEIENSRGGNVLETEPNDGINTGNVQLQSGQTYRIRLRSASKSGSPTYDVTLQFDGVIGGGGGGGGSGGTVVSESEPNNSPSQAKAFTFPEANAVQLQGVASGKKDNDFFQFTAAQSGTISVAVAATGSLVQLEVETTSSVNVFETDPKDGVNSGTFQIQAGVTYFLRLRSKSDANGNYLTDLAFTPVS